MFLCARIISTRSLMKIKPTTWVPLLDTHKPDLPLMPPKPAKPARPVKTFQSPC